MVEVLRNHVMDFQSTEKLCHQVVLLYRLLSRILDLDQHMEDVLEQYETGIAPSRTNTIEV